MRSWRTLPNHMSRGTTTIKHLDGKRVVTVSSNIDTDKITSIKINSLLEKKFRGITKRFPGLSV